MSRLPSLEFEVAEAELVSAADSDNNVYLGDAMGILDKLFESLRENWF